MLPILVQSMGNLISETTGSRPSHKRRVGIFFFAVFQRLSVADAEHLAACGAKDGIGSGGVPFFGLAVADVNIGATLSQAGELQAAALRIDNEVGMGGTQYLINIFVHLGRAVRTTDENGKRTFFFNAECGIMNAECGMTYRGP